MASRKFDWSFPAFVALFVVAAVTLLHWILTRVEGSVGELMRIVNFIKWIVELLGYFFVAIYAYDYVRNKKGNFWIVVYWLCIIVVVVFHILGWFW